MKKIYFLLALICSLCAFTACSDDKEDPTPTCPVTEYSVPAKAAAGSSIEIPGKGFATGAKIILKNAQNLETTAENIVVSATAVSVTIPAGLAPGSYKVILRQSGDWELGSITVEAAGPIKDLVIPEHAAAGEQITIQGKGFDENTKIYLESDELTADGVEISNITENGLTLTLPVTIPGGSYRVMLDQENGIQLGTITITERETPVVVSRIIIDMGYATDSIIFNYTDGKVSSINFISYEEQIYTITYPTANSIVANFVPADEWSTPVTWEYTLSDGKVTAVSMKTKEMQYDDEGVETGAIDKTYEYTFNYTPEDYLAQISKKPDDGGYDTLSFNYNGGQISKLDIGSMNPIWGPSGSPTGEMEYESSNITFNYAKQIDNAATFDLMSIIMNEADGSAAEQLARLLGIGGKSPSQLPTSYTNVGGEQKIEYTIVNGYVTKIEFPDEIFPDDPEPIIYRIEYQ